MKAIKVPEEIMRYIDKFSRVALGGLLLASVIIDRVAAQDENRPRRGLPFYGVADVEGALRNTQASLLSGKERAERDTGQTASSEFDRIMSTCGPSNDWQDVELYNGRKPTQRFVNDHQPAVAQIQWRSDLAATLRPRKIAEGNVSGERWCTGTLIASNLFLTAAHCFEPQDDLQGWQTPRHRDRGPGGTVRLLSAQELAPLMQVNFRYQVNGNDPRKRVREPDVYPIVRLVEYGFDHQAMPLDYAIVEIGTGSDGKQPDAKYAITAFDASETALAKADLLTIIQHPHGLPKKVLAGPKAGQDGEILLYKDLDTLGGSSGSGVLDDRGKVIAVHTNGGCTQFGGANRGVTLKAVRLVSQIVK